MNKINTPTTLQKPTDTITLVPSSENKAFARNMQNARHGGNWLDNSIKNVTPVYNNDQQNQYEKTPSRPSKKDKLAALALAATVFLGGAGITAANTETKYTDSTPIEFTDDNEDGIVDNLEKGIAVEEALQSVDPDYTGFQDSATRQDAIKKAEAQANPTAVTVERTIFGIPTGNGVDIVDQSDLG